MKSTLSKLFGNRPDNQRDQTGPVDLTSDDFFQNPYPVYERLRTQQALFEAASGGYVLCRYDDILNAFTNPALVNTPSRFSVLKPANANVHPAADFAQCALPFRDGPGQKGIRKACLHSMSAALPPKPAQIRKVADKFVTQNTSDGTFDLIENVATPFAREVMCSWFGFDGDDKEQLAAWSESIFRLFTPLSDRDQLAQINRDVTDFRAYVRARINENRDPDSVLSVLSQSIAQQDGNEQDAIDNAILIFMDGIENVRYGAGNAAMEIFQHVEKLPDIARSTASVEQAVQETLRLHSPASIISRIASDDISLLGTEIKRGTPVYLLLGSANRDKDAFDHADEFIPDRRGKSPLLFGHGPHSCIGGSLAISMIGAVVESLIGHNISHVSSISDIVFIKRFGHRWPEAVYVST